MAHSESLVLYHSKSTALVDGEAGHDGLGRRISADLVAGLSARPLVQLTGVVISKVSNSNLAGAGSLHFVASTKKLQWRAPRDTDYGAAVDITAGGTFSLESWTNNAWITVTVTALSLPVVSVTEKVVLTLGRNNLYNDVAADQLLEGITTYRALFLKNIGATSMKNVRPYFEMVANVNPTSLVAFYASTGAVAIEIEDPEGYPPSGFLRNVRTSEIMLYTSRSGDRGEILSVPIEGRALRDTGPGEGLEDDLLELVSPLDIFLESYNPVLGAASIARETLPPAGATFYYPDPSDEPQYGSVFTLAAGAILTIWLRREIPAGAANLAEVAFRLAFKFDDV